jgi:hypothetical protein
MAQSFKRAPDSRCFSDGSLDGIAIYYQSINGSRATGSVSADDRVLSYKRTRFREMTSVLYYRFGHLRTKVFTTNDMQT